MRSNRRVSDNIHKHHNFYYSLALPRELELCSAWKGGLITHILLSRPGCSITFPFKGAAAPNSSKCIDPTATGKHGLKCSQASLFCALLKRHSRLSATVHYCSTKTLTFLILQFEVEIAGQTNNTDLPPTTRLFYCPKIHYQHYDETSGLEMSMHLQPEMGL